MRRDSPAAMRRERELARTRDDILTAAERVFARFGVEATTMQAIAREAGYTAPSLYTYFSSRGEIFDAIFSRITDALLAVYDEPAPEGLDFRGRLDRLVRAQIAVVEGRRHAFAVFTAVPQLCGGAPSKAMKARNGWGRWCGQVEAWLERNASAKDLGGHDARRAALALMGILRSFFLDWVLADDGRTLGPEADAILDLFVYGLQGSRLQGSRLRGSRRGRSRTRKEVAS